LLVSPLPGIDPPNGDVTYTLTLLQNAPVGFEYVTYADALESGDLRERNRRSEGLSLGTIREAAVNRLRRSELLFREPFRFFDVKPGVFDLIHCHAFTARFSTTVPIVVSNSAASEWLYRDGEGWSAARVAWGRLVDQVLARLTGVNHVAYGLPRATRVISFSEYLRDWYVDRGVAEPARIDVVPPGIEVPELVERERPPSRLLYAGDFDIKGGDVALAAFDIVRRQRPGTSLTIVGSDACWEQPGVTWLGRLPRERFLDEVMPTADIFVYPTRFDGLPLSLLEAMGAGLAVAASDYRAIPEVVGDAGLTSSVNDAQALAENILTMLEPEACRRMSVAARQRVIAVYSRDATRELLLSSYTRALSA
jgi:glycosyltransferase involved in cell wall biosynthesis